MSNNKVKEFFSNTINHRIERAPELANLPNFDLENNNRTCSQIAGSPLKHNIILNSLPFSLIIFCTIYMELALLMK